MIAFGNGKMQVNTVRNPWGENFDSPIENRHELSEKAPYTP